MNLLPEIFDKQARFKPWLWEKYGDSWDNEKERKKSANRNINDVFSELDRKGIRVTSMRNKTNRLEQLFMSRIEESSAK